jgi:choline dehydrogenase-like flavoprotein
MTRTKFDAIVVGSGASGSFAAKELTERGLDVALIEAGPEITANDFAQPPKGPVEKGIQLKNRAIATLMGQHVQAKVAFFGNQFKHLFVNDLKHPYTTTRESPYLWIRGKQLGGRLHTYGRVLMRWSDTDFKAGSRDGKSPDWPISYADLDPYYTKVEEFLGLCGTVEGIPNLPDGRYLKPSHLTALERRLKDAAGRWPERKVIPWRYMPPNEKRVPQPILAAQATGRLTVFADSIARQVNTDAAGNRATGVEILNTRSRASTTVEANVVVLCCSPIETVRLMLNSASDRAPQGLGNSSGVLGRYFMDQVPLVIFGTVPDAFGKEDDPTWPADAFYGKTGGAYIPRWVNVNGAVDPDFVRGFGYQGTAGRLYVPETRNSQFAFMGFGEMLPDAENRVTLDPRKRDAWNLPVPHIRCWMGENERRMLKVESAAIKEMADAAGFETEWIGSPLGLQEYGRGAYPNEDLISRYLFRRFFRGSMTMGAAIHESGGARMGDDPKTSVLNNRNQAWDVKNLFVTDASAFPTSGTAGTTLTIMALTIRACEYIAAEYGAGRL